MQRCDLPFSRYSRSNCQNLGPKFRIWDPGGTAPKEEDHPKKFHADRCHCRRDICNRTKKKQQLSTLLYQHMVGIINPPHCFLSTFTISQDTTLRAPQTSLWQGSLSVAYIPQHCFRRRYRRPRYDFQKQATPESIWKGAAGKHGTF